MTRNDENLEIIAHIRMLVNQHNQQSKHTQEKVESENNNDSDENSDQNTRNTNKTKAVGKKKIVSIDSHYTFKSISKVMTLSALEKEKQEDPRFCRFTTNLQEFLARHAPEFKAKKNDIIVSYFTTSLI